MGCGGSKGETQQQDTKKGNPRGGRQNQGGKGQGQGQGQQNQGDGPVKEKGYKKRIRDRLRQATLGNDLNELEEAIKVFEKNKLEDGGDLADAQEKLRYLQLKKEIRDAILRRHPGILDRGICNVENSEYAGELQNYLERARYLRQHLDELDKYRHDILEMKQETISEIRSYHHPPEGVHEIMTATYMLLGYEEQKLKNWEDIQHLLGMYGPNSMMRKIRTFDTEDVEDGTCKRVTDIQKPFELEKVRAVSNGAATFHVWNSNMVDKAQKDQQGGQQQGTPRKGQTPQKGQQKGQSQQQKGQQAQSQKGQSRESRKQQQQQPQKQTQQQQNQTQQPQQQKQTQQKIKEAQQRQQQQQKQTTPQQQKQTQQKTTQQAQQQQQTTQQKTTQQAQQQQQTTQQKTAQQAQQTTQQQQKQAQQKTTQQAQQQQQTGTAGRQTTTKG